MAANSPRRTSKALEEIGAAATEAITTGLRRYGPEAVGVVLLGLATVLVTGASMLLVGAPVAAAAAGSAVTGGAAAAGWTRFRKGPPP
jgi:translation initiation factor 2B subunit (eIF-2B alpha/beta/delta family)